MPEPREKPKMEKPKAKNPSVLIPKQAARVLASNYPYQLEQRIPGEENETEYATGRAESAAKRTTEKLAEGIHRFPDGRRKVKAQWKTHARQNQTPTDGGAEQTEPTGQPNVPKERPATEAGQKIKGRKRKEMLADRRVPDAPHPGRQAGSLPGQATPKSTVKSNTANRSGAWRASDSPPAIGLRGVTPKERSRATAATIKTSKNVRAAAKASGKADVAGAKLRRSKDTAQALHRTRQNMQRQMTQRMITQARKTEKAATLLIKKAAVAVKKAATKLFASIVGLSGSGILLIVLMVIFVIAAIGNSPFGIFFAAERSAPNAVSVSEAVSAVNIAYNAKLEELQCGNYDSIVINGQAADWPEILAVFAAKTAGAEDGVDVATLDADRVQRLTNVFWDMTAIITKVETIYHPGSGEDNPGWTEHILHISITAKSADDMRTQYGFTKYQNNALDELLAERVELVKLSGSLTITNVDVKAVLDALPGNLPAERRETVKTALTLVGKVNYFWGGKSSAIGWDSRWGTLRKVTAPKSSTTGTYRPFGLDCSGYVDWVFNNSLGYVIGHGGGTYTQHAHCRDISSAEALPGDLAFYPDDSHVGIVVGRSNTGGILVAHCSSGSNNVVVTDFDASGFTVITRPDIFD